MKPAYRYIKYRKTSVEKNQIVISYLYRFRLKKFGKLSGIMFSIIGNTVTIEKGFLDPRSERLLKNIDFECWSDEFDDVLNFILYCVDDFKKSDGKHYKKYIFK